MPTQQNVQPIIEFVKFRLKQAKEERGINLVIDEQDTRLEDDWLYVTVAPGQAGGRASAYAELMSEIEKDLRNEGFSEVLLVPVLAD